MFAGKLVEQDLTFDPLGIVDPEHARAAGIEGRRGARFLRRRPQGHGQEVDLVVIVPVDADRQHAGRVDDVFRRHVVGTGVIGVCDHIGEVFIGRTVDVAGRRAVHTGIAADALAGFPLVGVGGRTDDAQRETVEIEPVTGRHLDLAIGVDIDVLQHPEFRIHQRPANGLLLFGGQVVADAGGLPDRRNLIRQIAQTVIIAQPVGVRAGIGQTAIAGGHRVETAADTDRQEGIFRQVGGFHTDHATAELARKFRREGLLDQDVRENVGREDVERGSATEGFRRRHR